MTDRTATPPPLLVAAVLVGLEGLLLLGYAVLEIASVSSDRIAVAVTTSLFFALFGGLLVVAARSLILLRSWARSPAVLAQLIALGVAWSFRGGDTTGVAIGIAVVALVVLAGLLSPSSTRALSEDPVES